MTLTQRPTLVVLTFICLSFLVGVNRANAAPITIQFTGVVTQVPIDDLYGNIVPGDLLQGFYTFDPAAPDLIPGDATMGSYTSSGAPFGMGFTIAGHNFTTPDSLNIGISNFALADIFTALAASVGGGLTLELFLFDGSATALSSDGLPLSAPALISFALADFHLHEIVGFSELQVDGQLSSLSCLQGCDSSASIPEPDAGLLVSTGLIAIALLRSRLRSIVWISRRYRMPRSLWHCFAYAFGCVSFASALLAVDGVFLIDQNRALAGNVTPGDTPGFPITISQPGSYRLSGNLTVPNASTTAIRIQANHVTVDLNGFSILGPVDCTAGPPCAGVPFPPPEADGIEALQTAPVFNITIRNGTIQGMGRNGIRLFGGSNLVEYVHARSNGSTAMVLASSATGGMSIVQHCTIERNGLGLMVGRGRITNTTVESNGVGITMESGNIANNVIARNVVFGILATNRVSYYGNVLDDNTIQGGVNLGQNLCNGVVCP